MKLMDSIFLVTGIVMMILAVIFGSRLGPRPVEFGFNKLGLILKADWVPLIFLLGFLMTLVGVFFRYQGYESEAKKLQSQLSGVEGKLQVLTDELQEFKNYDLGLNLVFPDSIDPRPLTIKVHTKKLGSQNFLLRSDIQPVTDVGGTSVNVNHLSRGEKIMITAEAPDSRTWVASGLEIPKIQVQMVEKLARNQGQR
jgi:hypothetical protein